MDKALKGSHGGWRRGASAAAAKKALFNRGFVRRGNDLSAAGGKATRTRANRETSCYRSVTYGGFGRHTRAEPAKQPPTLGRFATTTDRGAFPRARCSSPMSPIVRSIAMAAVCALPSFGSLAQTDDPMAKAARKSLEANP